MLVKIVGRVTIGLVLTAVVCWLASCGGISQNDPAVSVGDRVITRGMVKHVMSVLLERGASASEPGRAIPTPPDYRACIAEQRAHPSSTPAPVSSQKQPKAFCKFEYERFKLKALYLLISYQWVTGEAAELGVKVDRTELLRQLGVLRQGQGLATEAAFRQYLHYAGANIKDIYLSLELAQLATKVEEKVGSELSKGETVAVALARFGKTYKRKWLARTDCRSGYIVPICRQYKRPKTPPAIVPPSVPLTALPAGN